jgi:hypothetical protein
VVVVAVDTDLAVAADGGCRRGGHEPRSSSRWLRSLRRPPAVDECGGGQSEGFRRWSGCTILFPLRD